MIHNENIERLLEIAIVQDLVKTFNMKTAIYSNKEQFSLILYVAPLAILISDRLIENIPDILIYDLKNKLFMTDWEITDLSNELFLIDRSQIAKQNFEDFDNNDIFISEGASKMFRLYSVLLRTKLLLPLFLAKNGFKSLKDGTFDSRFDFQNQTYSFNPTEFIPMYKALSLDIP